MNRKRVIPFICFAGVFIVGCMNATKQTTAEKVVNQFRKDISVLKRETEKFFELVEADASAQQIQNQFRTSRAAYKQTEWLAEYYNPFTAKFINGPALQEVEPEDNIVIEPEGFQVIEELIFPAYNNSRKEELMHHAKTLRSNISRLANVASLLTTTDAHVFDALRLEVFRIIALGISGFDSPIAGNSIPEAASSLEAVRRYLTFYQPLLLKQDIAMAKRLDTLFSDARQFTSGNQEFASFNRMEYVLKFLNPLSEHLLNVQATLVIPVFKEARALRADAKTLFAENIFNADVYTSGTDMYSNELKVALGKKLFNDPILSGNGKVSCASCHQQQKAFTDGLATGIPLKGKKMRRNVPTLVNAALQPALFYDLRVNYLEDQARDVINNNDEMHGSFNRALNQVESNKQYKESFRQVYAQPFSEGQLKNAIASYIRSLVALDTRFDKYMRGDAKAMNKAEVDGFNLFVGRSKCGTCHFLPLFNGANPPVFDKIDTEVIGVPGSPDTLHSRLDSDEGKSLVFKDALNKFHFKTPTLRNIELTAPYMHNGVFKTLEEVVEFYNRGGGKGLGFRIDNQTLPGDRLHLTAYEKKALVDFMKALTDTSYNRH